MRAALIVFAAMFSLDFVWAFYTKAIQKHRPLAAAWWAVAIIVFTAVAQIGYINDPILVLPAALGAFAGTYAAMKWAGSGDHAGTTPRS